MLSSASKHSHLGFKSVKPRVVARKFYTITNAVELATLPVLIVQFLDAECVTAHTHKAYSNSLKHFQNFLAGKCNRAVTVLSYSDVSRAFVKDFYNYRLLVESQASAELRLRVVKSFCSWMHRRYSVENHGINVSTNLAPSIDFKGLTSAQYLAFTATAKKQKSPLRRFIPMLLVGTGLRNNEARHLTLANISKDAKWLLRVKGKGGKIRNIPLTDETTTELQIYMWWRQDFGSPPDSPLLLSRVGGHLGNKTIWRIVQVIGALSGLPEDVSHPHALRHTFAYRTLEHLESTGIKPGRALNILKDILGHSSINTTMRYLGNQEEDVFELMRGMK
jgi:site-specific recombinase XerD